ncbi:transcriptional regulator, TetR family [Roseovarius litoreus]|jgi:AcrR family transcriptional regulator|uniref:Transcriptional regulator, TetR family n=1 Tax=Roseovarius litoreus TaxID=1155722 RepID=A0A1M7EFP4_9RHOB|nr:TetR/AcrR family transcriptional regulator [Roseovarius litoreus]SHL90605.1 transcriptional regulator, TetR family [Roseovarius litoreus]
MSAADPSVKLSAPRKTKGALPAARPDQIMDIAARQFRARGYAAVSLRDIATEAGMRTPSLYYHFPSKDDLVIAVMNRGIAVVREAVTEALAALPPDAEPFAKLETAMRVHLRALHGLSDYTSANVRIFGQLPEELRRANLPERRAYQEIWADLLSATCPDNLEMLAIRVPFVIGALNATLEWFDPDRGDLDVLADQVGRVLLAGLKEREDR